MKKHFIFLLIFSSIEFVSAQLPNVPVLVTPSNGSVNMGLFPVFDWVPGGSGATHRFQISLSPSLSPLLLDTANIPFGQLYIPAGTLQQGNTYYWRVNATNASGTTAYSNIFHFSTVGALPIASALYLPANGAAGQSLTPSLTWQSQLNIVKYHIQVSSAYDFSIITDSASVTTAQRNIPAGKLLSGTTYYWRVKATNFVGTGQYSSISNFSTLATNLNFINSELPKEFKLYENYPNPFNPVTNITFSIPKAEQVALKIYNSSGILMIELLNNSFQAGTYITQWNAENFSSGVYFYTLQSSSFNSTKRMILIK